MATENQAQATEQQPQLPLADQQSPAQTGGEQLEPTTITLEDAEAAPQQETRQEPEKPSEDPDVIVDATPTLPDGQKPRKHVPTKQRINQLTARAKTAEERAAQLEEGIRQRDEALRVWQSRSQTTERQSMHFYAESLKAQQLAAEQAIMEAKSSGDVKAEMEAIKKMASVTADLRTAETYLARNPAQQQQPQSQQQRPQQAQRPQQNQQEQLTPEVQSWIKDNSWYDQQSPDFDPDMHQFAYARSVQLNLRLRRQGKEAEIGGPAYLAEINKAVREEFPDSFEDEPQGQPALRMQGRGPQAAIGHSNGAAQGIKRMGNQVSVQLSAEEREYARNMQSKHEAGPKKGQPMTDAEKEQRYARLKYDLANGKKPGGVEINMNIRGR